MTNIIKQIEEINLLSLIAWQMKTTAPPWRATLSTVLRETSTSRLVLELTTIASGELPSLFWRIDLAVTHQRARFTSSTTIATSTGAMPLESAGEAAEAARAALIREMLQRREMMREVFDFDEVEHERSDLIDMAQAATKTQAKTPSTKGATVASVNGEREVSELIRCLRTNTGLRLQGRRRAWSADLVSEGHRLAQRAVARLMIKLRSERFTVGVPFNVVAAHLGVNDSRLRDLVQGSAPRANGIRSAEADALCVPFGSWARAPTSDI